MLVELAECDPRDHDRKVCGVEKREQVYLRQGSVVEIDHSIYEDLHAFEPTILPLAAAIPLIGLDSGCPNGTTRRVTTKAHSAPRRSARTQAFDPDDEGAGANETTLVGRKGT